MFKLLYVQDNGVAAIVIPAEKEHICRDLAVDLTDEQYFDFVVSKSIPEGKSYKVIEDSDIPESREFRNAWCDVTPGNKVDIDCSKARDDALVSLRAKRDEALLVTDKEYMVSLSKGEGVSEINARKQELRDITNPLKALDCTGVYNDDELLDEIRKHRDCL